MRNQLRHNDAEMKQRYMKTLSKIEPLRMQKQVDFEGSSGQA